MSGRTYFFRRSRGNDLRITHNFFRVVPAGVGGNPVSLRSCLYLNDAGFPPETAGKTGTPSRGRLVGDA